MKGGRLKEEKDPYDSINSRLNALIRLTAESLYNKKEKNLQEGDIVRMLGNAGLTPTEIAKIMGKPGRTSVSAMLYGKRKTLKNDAIYQITEVSSNIEERT